MIERGDIRIEINQRFALAEAAKAHTELAARRTTGSTVLLP
ncbi:zinc-binding dehydrogenase [Pseudomonas aeruginosa]